QRVNIGALQLLKAAPLEHESRHLVRLGQFLQDINRGRDRAGLPIAPRRWQLQLLEQHLAELLRRPDVELDAGELVDAPAAFVQIGLEAYRLLPQVLDVHADSGALNRNERRDERPLERLPDARELFRGQTLGQTWCELQRKVGALAGEVLQRVGGELCERG